MTEFTDSPRWKAFGLGLLFPGAGFLAHVHAANWFGMAHLAVTILTLILFTASLVMWFATGNVLAPPAVWLLSAIAAAQMMHGEIADHAVGLTLFPVIAVIGATLAIALIRRMMGSASRRYANRYLAESGAIVAGGFQPMPRAAVAEFTLHDLKLMRFLLDRALQPIAAYSGFEWLDQFQTAAVRYQLNFAGYALSMAQATHLPALGGYLNDAQRNLIVKQTDHRIWRYWGLENLWGNMAIGADPVARENIMFTGFCAAQIGMFHSASGCRDYDRAGSFSLAHPDGRIFEYDYPSLIDALDREYRCSAFHLIACEPNWIYPLCNTIGAAAMKAHDRQTGVRRWASHEAAFRYQLEHEFIDLAGRFVPCRSTYTGIALPVFGGAMPQAMPSFFLNATMPDIALRQWLLLRTSLFGKGDRRTEFRRRRFWPIDTGNYRFSRAAAFAGTALAAVEMGDGEVAGLCLAALEEECPGTETDDRLYRPRASVWAHAVEFFSRSGQRDGYRTLVETPNSGIHPHISKIRYPDVLVARAHQRDGVLNAVLYPGIAGRHPLGLAGLVPGRTYVCDGLEEKHVIADSTGFATVHVTVQDRKEIRIRPRI